MTNIKPKPYIIQSLILTIPEYLFKRYYVTNTQTYPSTDMLKVILHRMKNELRRPFSVEEHVCVKAGSSLKRALI